MSEEISLTQVRAHIADVLRRVEAGESFRVTVDGRPVADLAPLPAPRTWVDRQRAIDNLVQADPALARELGNSAAPELRRSRRRAG